MDFRQLEAFVMVAKFGSFAAAADNLCITQPAVSIRISTFEQRLGSKLFDRAGRSVVLTPMGNEILPHATRMITDAQAFRRFAGAPKFLANRIRIGTTDSFLRSSLQPIISRFQALYPSISLDLSVGDTTLIWSELLSGKIDVGFHTNAQPHPAIRSVSLFTTDLIWVSKPDLTQADQELTLEQIAGFQIFTTRQGSIAYSAVANLFHSAEVSGVRICGINSVEAIIRFTEAELGVAVLTRIVAEERIKLGTLQELAPGLKLYSIQYVVSHPTECLSDAGRVLTDIASS